MIIDWTQAPIGTTHATISNGDPRWYKLEGGKVFCWAITAKEWMPSFFLSVDEIADSGLRLYANGEQSELVMLRERVAALEGLLRMVVEEIPHRKTAMRKGNAPGHGHSVPGIWDSDNGELAGKECAWCKVWTAAVALAEGTK